MKHRLSAIVVLLLISALALSACAGAKPQADGGMSGRMASAYIDMLASGTYFLKYIGETEFQGMELDVLTEAAVRDGDMAILSRFGDDFSTHIVLVGDKVYIIDHENETVAVMDEGDEMPSGDILPESGYIFVREGTSELLGVTRAYEEYYTDGGDVKFYFDGDDLIGFELWYMDVAMQMEVLEMSSKIPPDIFDIPQRYEVIEY